jgi:hypothetical protein
LPAQRCGGRQPKPASRHVVVDEVQIGRLAVVGDVHRLVDLARERDLGAVFPAQQHHATRRSRHRFAVLRRRRHRRIGLQRLHALAHGLLRLVGPHRLEFRAHGVELLLLRLEHGSQAIDLAQVTLLRHRLGSEASQQNHRRGGARMPRKTSTRVHRALMFHLNPLPEENKQGPLRSPSNRSRQRHLQTVIMPVARP